MAGQWPRDDEEAWRLELASGFLSLPSTLSLAPTLGGSCTTSLQTATPVGAPPATLLQHRPGLSQEANRLPIFR